MQSLTSLLTMHILRYMPAGRHHSLVCSAGSQGYHSLKEMLQSGVPGNTLLIESRDLREVVGVDITFTGTGNDQVNNPENNFRIASCCLVYTFDDEFQVYEYKDHIPETVSYVIILTNMGMLPPSMLALCKNITSVDMSLLPEVTVLMESFLEGCSGLTSIDLPHSHHTLSQTPITEIQGGFMEGCSGLKTIDLSALSEVTIIPVYFLQDCTGLTSINLSGLSNVEEIQYSFLYGCRSLTAIDLSPLSHVTEVGAFFLCGCSSLQDDLDLTPLSQLTVIPYAFLQGCTGLTSLDLTSLSNVVQIQSSFLKGCVGITTMDLSSMSVLNAPPIPEEGCTRKVTLPPHLNLDYQK